MNNNALNDPLATTCQAACSACCCKGKIFLPNTEYDQLVAWLGKNSPVDVDEFEQRSESNEGFHLYDQKDRCQFLDPQNLCRLHEVGVKPRECFWWPLHVYTGENEKLEIRVSTSCCEAYKAIPEDSPLVKSLKEDVLELGRNLIKRFRSVYPGSYNAKVLDSF